jgi:hypothetical protein
MSFHAWGEGRLLQITLAVIWNPISSDKTKHINTIHHFTRERVEMGEVRFSYISTEEMVADILNKATIG